MKTCPMCFEEYDTDGPECESCQEHREYYDSLTPAERREEFLSIARHVQEGIDRGD